MADEPTKINSGDWGKQVLSRGPGFMAGIMKSLGDRNTSSTTDHNSPKFQVNQAMGYERPLMDTVQSQLGRETPIREPFIEQGNFDARKIDRTDPLRSIDIIHQDIASWMTTINKNVGSVFSYVRDIKRDTDGKFKEIRSTFSELAKRDKEIELRLEKLRKDLMNRPVGGLGEKGEKGDTGQRGTQGTMGIPGLPGARGLPGRMAGLGALAIAEEAYRLAQETRAMVEAGDKAHPEEVERRKREPYFGTGQHWWDAIRHPFGRSPNEGPAWNPLHPFGGSGSTPQGSRPDGSGNIPPQPGASFTKNHMWQGAQPSSSKRGWDPIGDMFRGAGGGRAQGAIGPSMMSGAARMMGFGGGNHASDNATQPAGSNFQSRFGDWHRQEMGSFIPQDVPGNQYGPGYIPKGMVISPMDLLSSMRNISGTSGGNPTGSGSSIGGGGGGGGGGGVMGGLSSMLGGLTKGGGVGGTLGHMLSKVTGRNATGTGSTTARGSGNAKGTGSGTSSAAAGRDTTMDFDPGPLAPNALGKTMIDRSWAKSQLSDSVIKDLWRMTNAEVGGDASREAKIIQLEEHFNRAQAVRGNSITNDLIQHKDASRGYYGSSAYWSKEPSAAELAAFKRDILNPVVEQGSNIGFDRAGIMITGNASGSYGKGQARDNPSWHGTVLSLGKRGEETGKNLGSAATFGPELGSTNEGYFEEHPFNRKLLKPRTGGGVGGGGTPATAPHAQTGTVTQPATTKTSYSFADDIPDKRFGEHVKDGVFSIGEGRKPGDVIGGFTGMMGGNELIPLDNALKGSLTEAHYQQWRDTGTLDPRTLTEQEYNQMKQKSPEIAKAIKETKTTVPVQQTGTTTPQGDKASPPQSGAQPGKWYENRDGKLVEVEKKNADAAPKVTDSQGRVLPDRFQSGAAAGYDKEPDAGGLHQTGQVLMSGKSYDWGSGGGHGGRATATPMGNFYINIGPSGTPGGGVGPKGQRWSIPAVAGLNITPEDNMRQGEELHSGLNGEQTLDKLYTDGCFAILPAQWPAFKAALLEKAKNEGKLMLHKHFDENGKIMATITSAKDGQLVSQDGQPTKEMTESKEYVDFTHALNEYTKDHPYQTRQDLSGGTPKVGFGGGDQTTTTKPQSGPKAGQPKGAPQEGVKAGQTPTKPQDETKPKIASGAYDPVRGWVTDHFKKDTTGTTGPGAGKVMPPAKDPVGDAVKEQIRKDTGKPRRPQGDQAGPSGGIGLLPKKKDDPKPATLKLPESKTVVSPIRGLHPSAPVLPADKALTGTGKGGRQEGWEVHMKQKEAKHESAHGTNLYSGGPAGKPRGGPGPGMGARGTTQTPPGNAEKPGGGNGNDKVGPTTNNADQDSSSAGDRGTGDQADADGIGLCSV